MFNKYKLEIEKLKAELSAAQERERGLVNEIMQTIDRGDYKISTFCNGCSNLKSVCIDNTDCHHKYTWYCQLNNPCNKYMQ